jgi:predicted DsbA family dithiol-disulfide isomerase
VTTSNNTLDMKQLPIIAKQLGLDGQAFQTCLDSGQYAPRVNFDVQNAEELGASGTPYSVVIDTKNNDYYPIEGAYPYDQLKNVLEIILKS